ncbi:MAG: response regulator transcription factor [Candidatus Methylacidiphilales bacterium]|nr:response regulator [Candidatus Methylacidiphilales bacterium]
MNVVPLISIVDDDESVRESLESLLKSMGFRVGLHSGAESFLISPELDHTDCLILDVRLGGKSGPELQRELIAGNRHVPTVFITGHGDAATRRRVMADGAIECLSKPFSDEILLSCVRTALDHRRKSRDPGSHPAKESDT